MNHIFQAVEAITNAPNGNTAYEVFSYKNPGHFRKLWGLNFADPAQDSITTQLKCWAKKYNGQELTIAIVWDGMPTDQGDPLNVSGFVSPHDWVLAASWLIYENSCLQDMKLRVLILNVEHSASSFASRSLFAFQNALPWIQDYRVVSSDAEAKKCFDEISQWAWGTRLRQAFPLEIRDLEIFVKDLLCPSRILTTYSDDDLERKHYIELTRELWKQNLLNAGTRHSVANLVAPTVLASGLPGGLRKKALEKISEGSLMRRALISTLREIGFLETSSHGPSRDTGGLLSRYSNGVFGRLKDIRFVLVDDHFDLGYHHVLGYTLFGEGYDSTNDTVQDDSWCRRHRGHSLNCYKNLECLLECLNNIDRVDDWRKPRYLFGCKYDVLLLDLRLWEDGNKEKHKEPMKRIVKVAKRLLGDPPEPEKVSVEFRRAFEAAKEASCNSDKFSPQALTLLPLLLSYIDRTLPIVLFTSSHQRVVSEMLRHRPNVITSFAKPLVSGYGEAISPLDSIRSLEEAIEKALDLHEARIAWGRICNLSPEESTEDIYWRRDGQCAEPVTLSWNDPDPKYRLADMFETCVFGESIYESLVQPWEFLESEAVNQCPRVRDWNLDIQDSRGYLARGIKEVRNAKTHGDLDRDRFTSPQARQVAVLQILFLLDFIEGNYREQDMRQQDMLSQRLNCGNRGPKHVMELLVNKVMNQQRPNRYLQQKTVQAMKALIRSMR